MEAKIIGTGKDAKLQITLSISEHDSATGKSVVIASTNGNQPTALHIRDRSLSWV